ncbi:histone acetyltransferase type b catalytic subunit protein [Rutstroemia sp. NJR-2017a BBW]|nr:histone acetyltransferase type b catalytic subunit protein [Rutstroemia sp. NJR-2017a BBW]
MADINADWSADANEALQISLVTPGANGTTSLHTFHPRFTYPIFGDEESIFGYQALNINLKFNASDMRPGLQITYNKKFKAVGDVEPADLKEILEPFLPKTAFEKTSVFESTISSVSADWHPPGELYETIETGGETYEIWKGNLADLAVQQMIKRIQILVPLFIEGGTLLDMDTSEYDLARWTVFFLYTKRPSAEASGVSPYVFMGYSTIYRYYFYTPVSPPQSPNGENISPDFTLPVDGITFSSIPCRSRISQFVILPPFQGGGHGSRFYNAIFDYCFKDPYNREITVEDPNEAFDDLRDINDLARLRKNPSFLNLKINPKTKINPKGPAPVAFDSKEYEAVRLASKIAPRQFARVHEMQLLSEIPASIKQPPLLQNEDGELTATPVLNTAMLPPAKKEDKQIYDLWRILVKQRLYRHNKDALAQLERGERIDKLDETLRGVEADYGRLIKAVDERVQKEVRSALGKESNGLVVGNGKAKGKGKGKRVAVEDDDAEDMDADEEPAAKKLKSSG